MFSRISMKHIEQCAADKKDFDYQSSFYVLSLCVSV